jgi:POT family proton-dependent oligopeptide transporter
MNAEITLKKKHPKGLYILFFTEMWERFSYYGMRAILILYLTKKYLEGGLGIDESQATLIYGYFTGLVYFTPLIGGWIADNFIGKRNAITIGGITMMLGQFTLFSINSHVGLYAGLFLLIIGNGFFKPNISTLVGGLYEEGDERRDSAFSIFYMGINIGALIAPFIIGFLTDGLFATTDASGKIISYGYKYGFLAAGIGMLLGQIIFNLFARKYLGNLGTRAELKANKQSEAEKLKETIAADLTEPIQDDNILSKDVSAKKTNKKAENQRISVIFIFFLFAVFFWAGFEQAGSSLSLYTDKFINRDIVLPFFGNYTIPTAFFQSVNPIFIVILAPLFAIFWNSNLGKRLSTPVKMGTGMVLLGIGFWFMLGAVGQRSASGSLEDEANKASLMWLIFTYLLHTIGELCLSPVGLSVVTKLSPPKLASLLMAVWLLASSVANFIGGYLASIVEKLGAGEVFTYISGFVILCGLLLLSLNKLIVRMMHGIK